MQDDTQQPHTPGTEPTPTSPQPTPPPFNPAPTPPLDSTPPVTPEPSPDTISSAPSPFGPSPASAPETTFGSAPVDQSTTPTTEPASTEPKPKKKLMIILLIAVLLLAAAAVVLFFLFSNNNASSNSVNNGAESADQTPASEKEAIAATKIGDFIEVCNGKKISNAPDLSTPNKTVPFINTTGTWALYVYSLAENDRLTTTVNEASVVACALPDEATVSSEKTCTVKDLTSDKTYSLTYKGVTYDLTFYAAKTGEKINSTQLIASGDTCPSYGQSDGEVFAKPTEEAVTAAFDEFFATN